MKSQSIELFSCLKITKDHPDFKGLIWVAKVRNLDPFRYDLDKFLCQEGKLIATDGMRMHIYKMQDPENIPVGSYLPVARNNGFILLRNFPTENYPNWKKVIPKTKIKTVLENICIEKDPLSVAKNFAIVLKNIDLIMHYGFFLDLAEDEWNVSIYEDSERPVRFDSHNKKKMALIMPMII